MGQVRRQIFRDPACAARSDRRGTKYAGLVKLPRAIAPTFVAVLLSVSLAACAAGPSTGGGPTPSATAVTGVGATASWASPVTTPGNLLTTVSGTNFTAGIYEVGTAKASRDGQFLNPETGKPMIAAGDKIVYVNYVFTNTGKTTIRLGFDLAGVEPRYVDWPFLQGMDSVIDAAQYKSMKVNASAIGISGGAAPYDWKPGTSFSYGQNFTYEANSPITFTVTVIPVLHSGDPDVANKQIVTADSTIE